MENTTFNDEAEYKFPLYLVSIFSICISVIILFGMTGNALTILAYFRDKELHSVYNTYLFNLAITDFLISTIDMPFYAVYTLQTFKWPFGYNFCKVYSVVDFTLCLESVVMIMIISFDRLLLLKLGPYYFMKITLKKAYIQIGISWIIAFLVYGPAIIGWDIWTGENILQDNECNVQFAQNYPFSTTTAFIEFGIPFICVGIVSLLIFLEIRRRNAISPIRITEISKSIKDKQNRDLKAATFLAALVIVFFVTWAPYTFTTVITSFCTDCVNGYLWEFLNWVVWSKSALNPFLYAYNSARFKKNIYEIVPCLAISKRKSQGNCVESEAVQTTA